MDASRLAPFKYIPKAHGGQRVHKDTMGLANGEYIAVGLLVLAVIVVGIVVVLKVFKFIIIAAILALIGYAFYAGWIHI